MYKCHYPFYDTKSCRGAKRSPVHTALEQRGAHFRDVSGWESADWYAPDGSKETAKKMVDTDVHPLGWGKESIDWRKGEDGTVSVRGWDGECERMGR